TKTARPSSRTEAHLLTKSRLWHTEGGEDSGWQAEGIRAEPPTGRPRSARGTPQRSTPRCARYAAPTVFTAHVPVPNSRTLDGHNFGTRPLARRARPFEDVPGTRTR